MAISGRAPKIPITKRVLCAVASFAALPGLTRMGPEKLTSEGAAAQPPGSHTMAEDQPQQGGPESGTNWDQISAQEIEQTLASASELAYELAGDIGKSSAPAAFRDRSELEAVETALDTELKQLEHLVGTAKQELGEEKPASLPPAPAKAASVPDFMSEFLTDEPVTAPPETQKRAAAGSHEAEKTATATEAVTTKTLESTEPAAPTKLGLVGTGTLGRHSRNARKADKPTAAKAAQSRPKLGDMLMTLLFPLCEGGVRMLEICDKPFSRLAPATRRALSVTAIAAFCVCLAMFVLSLLFS